MGSLFLKYLTTPEIGFDSYTLTFGYTGFTNFITLMVGIAFYWRGSTKFDKSLFLRGFLCSTCENVGLAFEDKATSYGPAGPISGLISLTSVFLTIYEAVILQQVPNLL